MLPNHTYQTKPKDINCSDEFNITYNIKLDDVYFYPPLTTQGYSTHPFLIYILMTKAALHNNKMPGWGQEKHTNLCFLS